MWLHTEQKVEVGSVTASRLRNISRLSVTLRNDQSLNIARNNHQPIFASKMVFTRQQCEGMSHSVMETLVHIYNTSENDYYWSRDQFTQEKMVFVLKQRKKTQFFYFYKQLKR